jgi:hypothetical protein
MDERLPVGQKELLRGKVMEPVRRGQVTIRTAAQELKASYRRGSGAHSREYGENIDQEDGRGCTGNGMEILGRTSRLKSWRRWKGEYPLERKTTPR